MMKSDFRFDVEIWPFCACTMKRILYNPYYLNSCVIVDSAVSRYHFPQNVFLAFTYSDYLSLSSRCFVVCQHLISSLCHTDAGKHLYCTSIHAVCFTFYMYMHNSIRDRFMNLVQTYLGCAEIRIIKCVVAM